MFYDSEHMNRDTRLLCGPLAAGILASGIVGVALMVPGYSQVRQTVSEIGEMDSPGRIPFTIVLCSVAACLVFLQPAFGLPASEPVETRHQLI